MAVPVERFNRFLTWFDGSFYFGLLGKDGVTRYFHADIHAMEDITHNLNRLLELTKPISARPMTPVTPDTTFIETQMAFTVTYQGGKAAGNSELILIANGGKRYQTVLGPQLTAQVMSSMYRTLSAMPSPPPFDFNTLTAKIPGGQHEGSKTVTYFGQDYRSDILQVVGVLIIRASVLETALVNLLSALADLTIERAQAMFYSSQNNKARLDLIASLIPASGANDQICEEAKRLLEKIAKLSQRRNTLVHGIWEFKKDKFVVKEAKPLTSGKQDPIQSYRSIEELASVYHSTSVMAELLARQVRAHRVASVGKSPER